jgi:carbon-monoxide dehydrogenase medium subunit
VKPPPFEYHAPQSASEALALLGQYGDEAKVLAGGQSLLPLLSLRLARPAHLIDINALDEIGQNQT